MFELPQGDHEAEGRCDESPIHLQGESVSEFKNFLWVLYALCVAIMYMLRCSTYHSNPRPHELADITGPQIDLIRVNRLIDIAKVSFKYHFRSLETWALDVINDRVTKSPPSIFYLPTVPMMSSGSIMPQSLSPTTPSVSSPQIIASNGALVSRLMRLAQLCGHERLLNTMISVCKQLMGFSIQYAHLAMTLADELDLRALRGIAYFEVMQKGNVVVAHAQTQPRDSPDSSPPPIVDAEGRLIVTHAQKLRLLTGYYRLTMVWERFRATPLTFEHSTACGATWHQHGCTQCWLDFWKEKTKSDALLSLGLADVLGRLRAIVKEFVKWGSATYMHQDCRTAVRKLIQEKIKAVEDELPDYFDEGLSSI